MRRHILPLLESRWNGQAGRLEVWYTTLTDPDTGTGVWIHHEMVAPADGGPARGLGWATVFPPGEEPVFARFGPTLWPDQKVPGFCLPGEIYAAGGRLEGEAGPIAWNLTETPGGDPLYTFPRWAWERELLPAAQIVPAPTSSYTGAITYGDRKLPLENAPGATAHIYGHGNARRWGWLHADLGNGDVCEVVAAVSTRPGLRLLPPLPLVRLTVDGQDWTPGDPLLNAFRLNAHLGLPHWTVKGNLPGGRRLSIKVTQHRLQTVSVDYADPDGTPAVCHNSERADAHIQVHDKKGALLKDWHLDGTAHAEIGVSEPARR